MSKRTTYLGTACVLGMALAAVPAAAATLTGFAGNVTTSYGQVDDDSAGSDTMKNWLLGGSVAGPLNDLPNLNFQFDASYAHEWANHQAEEVWNLGGSVFWANNDGRIGVNVNYLNLNNVPTGRNYRSFTNYGAIGEWYFGNVTGMAKAGMISTSGNRGGGHGTFIGAAISGYFMPDLALTGGVEYSNQVSGVSSNPLICATCGRDGTRITELEIAAEYLFSQDYGVAGFASYAHGSVSFGNSDSDDNAFRIGLRWYTGGGSLMDRHRNGNLNPWLPGVGTLGR